MHYSQMGAIAGILRISSVGNWCAVVCTIRLRGLSAPKGTRGGTCTHIAQRVAGCPAIRRHKPVTWTQQTFHEGPLDAFTVIVYFVILNPYFKSPLWNGSKVHSGNRRLKSLKYTKLFLAT